LLAQASKIRTPALGNVALMMQQHLSISYVPREEQVTNDPNLEMLPIDFKSSQAERLVCFRMEKKRKQQTIKNYVIETLPKGNKQQPKT